MNEIYIIDDRIYIKNMPTLKQAIFLITANIHDASENTTKLFFEKYPYILKNPMFNDAPCTIGWNRVFVYTSTFKETSILINVKKEKILTYE